MLFTGEDRRELLGIGIFLGVWGVVLCISLVFFILKKMQIVWENSPVLVFLVGL